MSYILVLDIGTTGARAALFDTIGQLQGLAYREYQSTYHGSGVIDHDPWTWVAAVEETVPEVLVRTGIPSARVEAVAITSQRATILPVDGEGMPLAPAILWQDKRTIEQCHALEQILGEEEIYRTTGLRIDPYFSLPKLMWFQKYQPAVYHRAFRFLTVHDWIVHRLTGNFCTDWTQASRTQLFDIRNHQWATEFAHAVGLPKVPMAEAQAPGSVAGRLLPQAAARLGLQAEIPVVMAGGDQQCAAVGLGVVKQGQVKVTTGTGTFIVAPVAKPGMDSKRRLLCSPSAVPNQWVMEAGIFTSGSVYRWLRNEVATSEAAEAVSLGIDPYERMNHLAAQSAPGAGGVLLVPHFSGSASPYWNPNARGVFFNLTASTSRAQFVRSTLEGIAIEASKNLTVLLEILTAQHKGTIFQQPVNEELDPIRVTGGLTKSDLFNQIQADVYGQPVIPGRVEQATALGAAVVGAVSIGWYTNIAAATDAMCHIDNERLCRPSPEIHHLYQQMKVLHDKIFQSLSDAGVYDEAVNLSLQLAKVKKEQ